MKETKEASGIANNNSGETEVPNSNIGRLHKRLSNELKQFNDFRPDNCIITSFNEQDPPFWRATFTGLDPYTFKDGILELEIKFPIDYPFKPPIILNPNIKTNAILSFDFQKEWNST